MLLSFNNLTDYKIEATDGSIGHVHDFLFDDRRWSIRYLVVDTGTWLPGRKVLLPPSQLGKPEDPMDAFPVELTREQVKQSPDIDTRKPVSRQEEIELHRYYRWPPYWDVGYDPIVTPYTPVVPPMSEESAAEADQRTIAEKTDRPEHPNLRSVQEVVGYKIHARDGHIGHVEDFLLDDANWVIRYMIVDTRDWLPGKKVLVPPGWARQIDWSEMAVTVDADREDIQSSPEYDPSAPVSRDYEVRLYNYYGWPKYWL